MARVPTIEVSSNLYTPYTDLERKYHTCFVVSDERRQCIAVCRCAHQYSDRISQINIISCFEVQRLNLEKAPIALVLYNCCQHVRYATLPVDYLSCIIILNGISSM